MLLATRVPTRISGNILTTKGVFMAVRVEGSTKIVKVVETMVEKTRLNSLSFMSIIRLLLTIMGTRTRTQKTNTIESRTNTTMSTMESKITMNPMTI